MPVGIMLSSMTYWEWLHWMAREAINPGGQDREDMRNALLISELKNLQIARTSDKVKPERYMIGHKLKEAARRKYEQATGVLTTRFDKKGFFSNLERALKKD